MFIGHAQNEPFPVVSTLPKSEAVAKFEDLVNNENDDDPGK